MTIQRAKYKKVLVIDDSEVDRYIASRNIKKFALAEEIVTKDSAKSALTYLASLAGSPELLPQLIFLDIRMPEIDGFGFLEEYSALPDSIKMNCIIMKLSTSLNPDDHERAINNQYVNRFMNKPLDKEKLESLINQ